MTDEYQDIKNVTIRGKSYTIRRFTDADDEMLATVADSAVKYRRMAIRLGCVDPKFENDEAVSKLDREVSLGLYVEIEDFNRPNVDFLQRLKNLRSQVSPLLEMSQQSVTLKGRSPSTNSSSATVFDPTKSQK